LRVETRPKHDAVSSHPKLVLIGPPFSQRSGQDVVGQRTAKMFSAAGIHSVAADLWPDSLARIFHSGVIPCGRRFFARALAPACAAKALATLSHGDIAWILGPAVPRQPSPREERQLKKRGVRYVFHVMDDWFNIPFLREATLARGKIADLVVVPTPDLFEKACTELPGVRVACLEEPVDVDRVRPIAPLPEVGTPTIVWTGNAQNTRFLGGVAEVLDALCKKHAFNLRIISGRRPNLDFGCHWEWLPYKYADESRSLQGALAGLSPLEDTTYNRSKGIFKVKTYMAAGIPVVGSNIGYQKELIAHGSTGFLCESISDWTQNLSALLENPSLAKKMGDQARSVAVSRFSHDAVKDSWISAVQNLLKS